MRIKAIAVLLFFAAAAMSCGANEKVLNSGGGPTGATPKRGANLSETAPVPPSSFDEDLASVKMADFTFLYVLRRKDGGSLDAEDKNVIRQGTDGATRRVATDGDKAFIIGSNMAFDPAKMKPVFDRFAVQDLSKPEAANINANLKLDNRSKRPAGNSNVGNAAVQTAD